MTSTTTCARCGADVRPDDRYCGRCSAPTFTPLSSSDPGGGASRPHAPLTDMLRERLQRATLGQYVIEAELGRGGMASVYLAHEIALDRRVAIKVMSPQLLTGEGMVDRFRHEAMTVARLSHPHIVTIHAVREDDDLHYFVMQYIEGTSLDRVVRTHGVLSIAAVQVVLGQVASALHYAHRRGVIHRDTKPANIMLDEDGNAIVTDFGIARVSEGPRLTIVGGTIGTPEYMSPEQCNALELTGASDQYSLGVVAYELLTGVPPFAGSPLTIMMAHARDPAPPLGSLRPDCPEELATIVARMLEKDPALRWPDMGAIVEALAMPALHDDHPVRRELAALAARDAAARPQVHVPVSPEPRPSLRTRAVASVRVEPAQVTVALGLPLQLRAVALDASGSEMQAQVTSWSSSVPAVVDVSPDGVVTGMALGLAEITAHVAGCTGSSLVGIVPGTVQVPRPDVHAQSPDTLARVATPPPPAAAAPETPRRWRARVAAGSALIIAIAVVAIILRFAMGGEQSATTGADELVSSAPPGTPAQPPDAPVVDPVATPPATADDPGQPRVDSTAAGAPGTEGAPSDAPAPIIALVLDPTRDTIEVGDSSRLIASLGSERAPGPGTLRWSSSDTSVGTVTAGLVLGLAPGALRIAASLGARSDTATIIVVPAAIASLGVAPDSVALTVGDRSTLRATALDGRSRPIAEAGITWRSSDPSVAAVDPSSGDLIARGQGRATITASAGGHAATARVTVAAVVVATPSPSPAAEPAAPPPRPSVSAVHAGGFLTCASATNGSVRCRGGGREFAMPELESDPTRLALGSTHACAIRGGRASCWGANSNGQLGDGTTRARSTPGPVSGEVRFREISVGASHTCAIAENGRAYCWGANNSGQLGDGSTRGRSAPAAVTGDLTFASVSAGREHSCAITTAGRAYCWGYGFAGALGHGFRQNESAPRPIDAGGRLTRIRAGANHTCALAATARVLCWGENAAGQLGDGTTRERLQPVEVARVTFTEIGVGDSHTCGLATNGSVLCWGDNGQGQLGTGNRTRRPTATPVASSERFTALTVGARHACALAVDGSVLCWGDDSREQIGVEGTSALGPTRVPALVRPE